MQIPSSSVARPATRRRRRVNVGYAATIIGFLLPAAIVYIALVLMPVLQAVYFSFSAGTALARCKA